MFATRPRYFPVLAVLVSLSAAGVLAPVAAASASRNVETWVQGELADYVFEQLTGTPRFAATSVHFVVFADGQPALRTNELALALRDGLRRSLAGRPGVRLGWQPDPAAPLQQLPGTAEHCDAMQPELLIGIELRAAGDKAAAVGVRALDDVERRWVPGFSLEWQGELTARQQRALNTSAADRAYLGRRDVPYDAAETDLIASHLARDLRCQLMRQVSGEYRLAVAGTTDDGDALAAVPVLVRHQVGGISSLQLLSDGGEANVELSGKLHPVSGTLHQYWLVLAPTGFADGLQPLSSSVYVEIPEPAQSAVHRPEGGAAVPVSAATVLSDLRLVRLSGDPACLLSGSTASSYGRFGARDRCAALRITAGNDAVVFVLNHQRNLGLVRLGDARCEPRPRAHVLRRGQSTTIRVPDLADVDDAHWAAVPTWSLTPAADVYYAIASNDSEAARAIAKLVAALPARCSDSVRPGLDGAALAHWLKGLSAELERRSGQIDWLAVETRNVL